MAAHDPVVRVAAARVAGHHQHGTAHTEAGQAARANLERAQAAAKVAEANTLLQRAEARR